MELLAIFLFLPVALMMGMGGISASLAAQHVELVRRAVTIAVASALTLASVSTVAFWVSGAQPVSVTLFASSDGASFPAVFLMDGISLLMLVLVTFVGLVVSRFSTRYLDGESAQGRYFCALGLTIGSVAAMVLAGNVWMIFAGWIGTSWGLHRLLLHYSDRPGARRAAWSKFAVSRIGDLCLFAALLVVVRAFGTSDLALLFERAQGLTASQITGTHAAIGWLLVAAAMTKSAQIPFHFWLPDTMETPTPVSALMHAGVVNAGGYLIIRLSPIVSVAPTPLLALAIVGGLTACLAGVVMMTQSSVKKTLAYSTVAQMGFMMLQCGLGAYSAAMLHILAHSLYKAHAFLSSGSVVTQEAATQGARSVSLSAVRWATSILAAVAIAGLAFALVGAGLGFTVSSKPGGWLFAGILCLALTTWGWRLMALGDATAVATAVFGMAGLCAAYLVSYTLVHALMAASLPALTMSPSLPWVLLGLAVAFASVFVLQALVSQRRVADWLAAVYVHASNGFYVDALVQRMLS